MLQPETVPLEYRAGMDRLAPDTDAGSILGGGGIVALVGAPKCRIRIRLSPQATLRTPSRRIAPP